jgi:hypothetical protein
MSWTSTKRCLRLSAALGSRSHSVLFLAAVIAVNLVGTEATPVTAQTYDAVGDFSLNNGNPNLSWSYGQLSAPGGTFTPYTVPSTNYSFLGEEEWSDAPNPFAGSAVHRNTTFVTQTYLTNVQPPDLLHLDSSSGSSDVRWTAPAGGGTYLVSGRFERIDWTSFTPVEDDIVATLSGTPLMLVSNPALVTYNAPAPFGFTVVMSPGDTLDFCQFSTGGYIGGGLAVRITSVPEPTSLFMLLGGLGIGIGWWRRRKAA